MENILKHRIRAFYLFIINMPIKSLPTISMNNGNCNQKSSDKLNNEDQDEPCYFETSLQLHLIHSSMHCMVLLQQKEAYMDMEYHENPRSKHLKFKLNLREIKFHHNICTQDNLSNHEKLHYES